MLVDAGNFFTRGSRLTRLTSVVAWKEMERLGYDAVTLGPSELEDWKIVKMLLADDTLRVVTTNLEVRGPNGWQPVGAPWRIVERGGLRIGILGILTETEMRAWIYRASGDSLRILPPVARARAAIHELAGRTDLILVLLAGTNDDLVSFAEAVPEAKVIVGGREPSRSCKRLAPGIDRAGKAVVNTYGVNGQTVGITRLTVGPDGKVIDSSVGRRALGLDAPEDTLIARDARRVVDIVRGMQEEAKGRYRE